MTVLPSATRGSLPVAASARMRSIDWIGIARVLALVVLTCVCYWPSLRGEFLWDDDLWTSQDPIIHAAGAWQGIWSGAQAYDYFPITRTMFWLEWHLWGADPTPYRVANLALHILNSFLLWRLLARLRVPGAWFGALLFAVHPLNVASVAWISERKNTLSLAFYLASLLCWMESEDGSSARTALRWRVLALAAFTLALLSKSSVVMLPCVLLLLVWWRRGRVGWPDVWRTAPFFGLSLVAGLVTIWFQHHRGMAPAEMVPLVPPVARVFLAARAILFYLGKAFLPLHLIMIYPRWPVPMASVTAALPVAGLAAAFGAAYLGRVRWGRGPFVALGYFVLTVLPASGLIAMAFSMHSFVSDHFVYVSLAGLPAGVAAAFAVAARHGGPGRRRIIGGVMGLLVVGCVVVSRERADQFNSTRKLWEATLRLNPDCSDAHNNLGVALESAGQFPAAEAEFRRVSPTASCFYTGQANLAGLMEKESRWPEAATAYEASLLSYPEPGNHNNLGVVYLQMGDAVRAGAQFRAALCLQPDLFSAHYNLYRAATALHDDPTAATALRACLRITPDDVPLLVALAALQIKDRSLSSTGQTVRLAEHACRLTRGEEPGALATLSRAYLEAGRRGDAIMAGRQAVIVALRRGQSEVAAEINRYVDGLRSAPPTSSPPSPPLPSVNIPS